MKKFLLGVLVLCLMSCLDDDSENADLCTEVFCGEVQDGRINLAIYNNTSVDFEEFIWNVGGQIDTVYVLSNNQFSCWFNLDSLHANYVYAVGISEEVTYSSDTVFLNNTASLESAFEGNYKLDIIRNRQTEKLTFSLFEGYNGDCIYF